MRVVIHVICIETVSERWKLLAMVLFQSPLLSDSFIEIEPSIDHEVGVICFCLSPHPSP